MNKSSKYIINYDGTQSLQTRDIRILTWNIEFKIDKRSQEFINITNVIDNVDFDFALLQETAHSLDIYRTLNTNTSNRCGIINYSGKYFFPGIKTVSGQEHHHLKNSLSILYNLRRFDLDRNFIFAGQLYDGNTPHLNRGRGYLAALFISKYDLKQRILVISLHQGHGKGKYFHYTRIKIENDFKTLFPGIQFPWNRVIIGGDFNNHDLLNPKYTKQLRFFEENLFSVKKSKVKPTCCVKPGHNIFSLRFDYVLDTEPMYDNSRVDFEKNIDYMYDGIYLSDHKPVIYHLKPTINIITSSRDTKKYVFDKKCL